MTWILTFTITKISTDRSLDTFKWIKWVSNRVRISCALTKKNNFASCMFISWTSIYCGLRSSPTNPWISSCHSQFFVLHWRSSSLQGIFIILWSLLYRFVVFFLICHVCLRVTMTSSTQCKITGYLPPALIWIGHFFVYHTCKKVRFTNKYVIN